MNFPQVWVCPTNIPLPSLYESFLDSEEIARGQRFKSPQTRQRYLIVRTVLRILLAENIGCSPQLLKFAYGIKGKPELINPLEKSLYFNVAHSGNYGLIGLHWHGVIGVDLELMEAKTDFIKLAQRFFAPGENTLLQSLQGTKRIQAFYQLWAAKEAFLKATGQGIGGGLDKVILAQSLDKYQSLPTQDEINHWQLSSQPLFDNYWTAIAWQGKTQPSPTLTIKQFTWDGNNKNH